MMGVNAHHATNDARSVADIRDAASLAVSLVLLALRRNVSQVALTRSARCHARRRAIGCHAPSGAGIC